MIKMECWPPNARTLQLPDEVLISEFAPMARWQRSIPFTNHDLAPPKWPEFTKATQGEFSGIGMCRFCPKKTAICAIVRPLPGQPGT